MSKKNRTLIIAGNWKMNHTSAEATQFFAGLSSFEKKPAMRVMLFPPFMTLSSSLILRKNLPIEIGAQNVHWEKSGAFTGEISGPMLSELGIKLALVGHSERRQYFGETDETVRKRADSLVAQGFDVIVCVGETRAEREAGKTNEVLLRQIHGAFPDRTKGAGALLDQVSDTQNPIKSLKAPVAIQARVIIAYEPVWAIGTGLTATPEQAEEAHAFIRKHTSPHVSILYGGSVSPQNIDALLACPNVDGGLVGGASLKPDQFMQLINAGIKAS